MAEETVRDKVEELQIVLAQAQTQEEARAQEKVTALQRELTQARTQEAEAQAKMATMQDAAHASAEASLQADLARVQAEEKAASNKVQMLQMVWVKSCGSHRLFKVGVE